MKKYLFLTTIIALFFCLVPVKANALVVTAKSSLSTDINIGNGGNCGEFATYIDIPFFINYVVPENPTAPQEGCTFIGLDAKIYKNGERRTTQALDLNSTQTSVGQIVGCFNNNTPIDIQAIIDSFLAFDYEIVERFQCGGQVLENSQFFNNFTAYCNNSSSLYTSQCASYAQPIGQIASTFDPQDIETKRPEHNMSCQGDPVHLHDGEFSYQCQNLVVPGRKMDVNIQHAYHSGLSINGQFGYGWFLNYYMRLRELRDGSVVIIGEGRKTLYTLDQGNTYHPPPGRFEVLLDNGDGTWTLQKAQGEEYTFDSNGLLTSIADRSGNNITLHYSATKIPVYGYAKFAQTPGTKSIIALDYQLQEIHDTNDRIIHLTYNADGLLYKIIDNAREVEFAYDPATNDLLTQTLPAVAQYPTGVTKTFEYEDHKVKKVQDAKLQYFVENFYDTDGRVERQNLGGAEMSFDYSIPGETTFTDRNGNMTTYTINENGNIVQEEVLTRGLRVGEPSSFTTAYTYNQDSQRTSITFPKNNGIKFEFDESNPDPRARGNLLEVRKKANMLVADNDTNDIVIETTYEPNFNLPKTITDALSRTTTFTYDYELAPTDPRYNTVGDVVTITHPTVAAGTPTEEFWYNSYSQVTKTEDPNNIETTYDYFPLTGYLKEVAQDPTGIDAITQYTYDSNGYLDTVTDAEDYMTDYDYNALGWLTRETSPGLFVTNYFHDANGNVERIERQANDTATFWQITHMTYDVMNNLKTLRDPLNRLTTYNYDNNENLEQIIDAENNITDYVYDERNKLFTVTDANTPRGVTTYDYDINGNLAKITDANTNPTMYAYDLFDRLDIMTYANSTTVNYDYDKNDNLDYVTLPGAHGTIDYVYDELNRMTNKLYPSTPSLNVTYDYDLGSRLTDVDNIAAVIDYQYDDLNRIDIVDQAIYGNSYTIDYDYFDNNTLESVEYPSTKLVEYTYDADNRLDLVKVGGTTLADYDYDTLSRLDVRTYPQINMEADYTFDIANQLSSIRNGVNSGALVSQHAYTVYDDVGNRKTLERTLGIDPTETINYGYNDIYELTSVTGAQAFNYQYDALGNRSDVDGVIYTPNTLNQYSDVDGTTFSYDDNGNTTGDGQRSLTYDEDNRLTTASFAGSNATYAYDGLGRRVTKLVDGAMEVFVHEGDQVIAEYDGSNTLTTEFVTGASIDEVLTMESGSVQYYYFQDGLGSVSDLVNTVGIVQETYEYDPYGNVLSGFSTVGNPYYFTSRRYDTETDLYHYRARAYSPEFGRFLQRDPIGYDDGMNIYAYVKNNSINGVDPSGEVGLVGAVVGAVSGGIGGFAAAGTKENVSVSDLVISTAVGAAIGGVVGTIAPQASGTAASILLSGSLATVSNLSGQVFGNAITGQKISSIRPGLAVGSFVAGTVAPAFPSLLLGSAVQSQTLAQSAVVGIGSGSFSASVEVLFDDLVENVRKRLNNSPRVGSKFNMNTCSE